MSSINVPVPMIVSSDIEAEEMSIGQKLTSGISSVIDKKPYLFRTSAAGSADVAVDKIVGGTVAWNQLVQTSDTSVTVTSGHKYLSRINGTNTIAISNGSAISINDGTKDNVFDLTAMFGSAIADYAYTLESNTAGAGVAWLKSYGFFTKPYYAYDVGGLQSVNTSAHKTVGFNQWDEEYQLGYYGSNGVFRDSTSGYLSSKNKIPVIPSTSYHIKVDVTTAVYICYYDGNGTFVERVNLGSMPTTQRDFTTPSYCYFINFSTGNAYGTTYNHDICVNLHSDGERDGEYEPYEAHTYALDSDLDLRGIPKLDASNNLYYDGDMYESDGTVTRNYASRAYTSGDSTDGSTMITDGTTTVYKLTTPAAEYAAPYTNPQAVSADGTEEYVDERDVPIPVGHETQYIERSSFVNNQNGAFKMTVSSNGVVI